jgi:hypothetical protein
MKTPANTAVVACLLCASSASLSNAQVPDAIAVDEERGDRFAELPPEHQHLSTHVPIERHQLRQLF